MQKINKIIMSFISIVLVTAMLFETSAFALSENTVRASDNETDTCVDVGEIIASGEENNVSFNEFSITDSLTGKQAEILSEVESKRTEDSKTFLMSDGSYSLVVYDDPVHYLDTDGDFVEYDNRLTDCSDEDIEGLENSKSDLKVKFSNKSKENNMVKMKFGDYQISWGYSDTAKVSSETISGTEQTNEVIPKNLSSAIIYRNIYEGTDVKYYVNSNKIKEEIILNSSQAVNEYTVTYKIPQLTAKQQDDQTILLQDDSGKTVYTISAPYMYDADGVFSSDITLEITEQKGNSISVKVTADKDWLADEERIYPVTLDPTVDIDGTASNISTTFVGSEYPTYNFSSYPYMMCETVSAEAMPLIKLNSLPELGDGNKLIGMSLSLYCYSSNGAAKLDAREITTGWDASDVTYEDITYSNDTIDYVNVPDTDAEQWYTWDIAKLAKKWYNGSSNNGIAIKVDSTTAKSYSFHSINCTDTNFLPYFTINYRNYSGLSNSLSYRAHNAGRGVGYVYDYTGDLVYNETLFESSGNKSSIDIGLTYNSTMLNETLYNGSTTGNGWQFSFCKKVEYAPQSLRALGYDYIYVDEYGNRQYFKQKSDNLSIWVCEDDPDVFINETPDQSEVILVENLSTLTYFDKESECIKGMYECDTETDSDYYWNANGDVILTYTTTGSGSSARVTSITDSVGRRADISYTQNTETGLYSVSAIDWFDGRTMSFTYSSSGNLTKITYPDSKTESFTYNTAGLLSKISSSTTTTTGYSYDSKNRISKVTEYTSSTMATSGNYLEYTYGTDGTTTVKDKKGLTEKNHFDETGKTVSVEYADGTTTNMSYSDGNAVSVGQGDKYIKNYIDNSSLERTGSTGFITSYWNSSKGGYLGVTSDTELQDGESQQYYGSRALKISHTDTDQYFTSMYQRVTDTSLNGKVITVSAYMKMSNVVRIYPDSLNTGAFIRIRFFDSAGNASDADSTFYVGTSKWQRISYQATVPSNTAYFDINYGMRYTSGTVWFDCLQIETNPEMHEYNMLDNNDFTSTRSWYDASNNTYSFTYSNGTAVGQGKADSEYSIFQTAYINRCVSSVSLLAKVKANSVPLNDDRKYGLQLTILYDTDTNNIQKYYKEFNANVNAYQTDTLVVSTKYTDIKVTSVLAEIVYHYNDNSMTVDSAMLNVSEEYTGFTNGIDMLPEPGPPESGENEDEEEPDTDTDYIGSITVTNGNTETTYYGTIQHRVAADTDVLDTTKPYTQSSTTYDSGTDTDGMTVSGGNYETGYTDERGNAVSYTVDPLSGLVTAVTDAKGNTTNYTYNNNNHNLLSVSSGDSTNTYTYNSKNQLSSISHNGFGYSFTYDSWGNLTKTAVGSYTLSQNTYESGNGNLTRTTYGNGDYFDYEYDDYGRIIKVYKGNSSGTESAILEYKYDAKNRIYKVHDYESNNITTYTYDLNGDVAKTESTNGVVCETVYSEEEESDFDDHIVTAGGRQIRRRTSYSEDGNVEEVTVNGLLNRAYAYDELGRNTTTTVTTYATSTDTEALSKTKINYTYLNYSDVDLPADTDTDRRTTNLTKKLSYAKVITSSDTETDSNIVSYSYKYDANGNITSLYINGSLRETYTYDALNQLTKVTGHGTVGIPKTYYTYDDGGNITRARKTITNSRTQQTTTEYNIAYTYGNSDWHDLLTQYGSDNITYDNVGNPLSYRNGMTMTWERGRLLSTLTNSTATYKYTYDANDIRTSKCNVTSDTDSDKYEYYYDDSSNLALYKTPYGDLHFIYDESGSIIGFRYVTDTADKIYSYIKNLQGDIMAITDNTGAIVAEYKYDVYGKIESVKTASGTTISDASNIGLLNPIRYRGYCYDNETGLYYLMTRYYDPTTGRFINADAYVDTQSGPLGTNMFAYCDNNVINRVDHNGERPETLEKYLKEKKMNVSNDANSAVHLKIKNNKITIVACIRIEGTYLKKKVITGIKNYWSNSIKVFGYKASITVSLTDFSEGYYYTLPGQKKISIKISKNKGVSKWTSGSIWKTWNKNNFGEIKLYKTDSRTNYTYTEREFEWVAAHEFGHAMGLKDAYKEGIHYGTIMGSYRYTKVQTIDAEKVIQAFAKNKPMSY